MKEILIWGAGREGRGFLADIFGMWDVAFVDKNREVVRALQQREKFSIVKYLPGGTETTTISGFRAGMEDGDFCRQACENADVIAVCVFPKDLPEVADRLARNLKPRLERPPVKKLAVLMCLNQAGSDEKMRELLRKRMTEQESSRFREAVCIADTIVRRICVSGDGPLDIRTNGFPRLLCQSSAGEFCADIEGVELSDRLDVMKTVKLYTYNLVHACYSYGGYRKGYRCLIESHRDSELRGLAERALGQSIAALKKAYGFSDRFFEQYTGELWAYAVVEALPDEITRVAADPVRKLSRWERIAGPALLCEQEGLPFDAIAEVAVLALLYREPADEAAAELQRRIGACGLEKTVQTVCGVELGNPLIAAVCRRYEDLS